MDTQLTRRGPLVADSGDDKRGAPGFRFPRWVWLAYALMLAAIATVGATSFWMEARRDDAAAALWPFATEEATSVVAVFALTPLIVMWTARLIPKQIGWPLTLAGHVAGVAAFSLLHIIGMTVLRLLVFPLFGAAYGGDPLAETLIYEGRKDALTYAGLVVGAWLLSKVLRRTPDEAAAPPAPEAATLRLEIRDGARRMWLAADEILWVEAAGNYVELHLKGRSVLRRQTLSAIDSELVALDFVRIHRSRLVNWRHVREAETNDSGDFTITLDDGRQISGSRRWRSALDRLAGR